MKEVLQVAYLRHLQDFCLFESVKDGIVHEGFLYCKYYFLLISQTFYLLFVHPFHTCLLPERSPPGGRTDIFLTWKIPHRSSR